MEVFFVAPGRSFELMHYAYLVKSSLAPDMLLLVFKILLITYKAHNNLAPSYIRDLLTPYIPSHQLRLSSKNLLVIPYFNLKTYGAKSFSIAAPTLWNTSPSDIMNSSSVSDFKNKLKTFLFQKSFFLI